MVQDHGDEGTRLGKPTGTEGVRWFGRLLGWDWPISYVEVLAKHDGVLVQDAIVFGFVKSIELFLLFHDPWHRPDGYWPVASDGCGNYFALAIGQRDSSGECPVVFFEMIANAEKPEYTVAESYAAFIHDLMRQQCERVRCPTIA